MFANVNKQLKTISLCLKSNFFQLTKSEIEGSLDFVRLKKSTFKSISILTTNTVGVIYTSITYFFREKIPPLIVIPISELGFSSIEELYILLY